MKENKFSKYEQARIIGARALQVSMDAPILIKLKKEELEDLNYDPLKIAEKELEGGVLPISVNRPMPGKKKEDIEKIKIEDVTENDEEKAKVEEQEEKEIVERGEMMELTNTEEDIEESVSEEEGLEDTE